MKKGFLGTVFFVMVISCAIGQEMNKSVVAVLDFESIGIENKDLGRAITEQFNTSLSSTDRFTIVERTQLGKLSEEHKLTMTGMVDQTTAVEIGQLVGAKILVMGSISKIGNTYNITTRFVDCQTGQITLSRSARTENLDSLPETIEYMVKALVDNVVPDNRKNEKNPKTAYFYSLALPGAGQAYAGSSTKRVLAFAGGALGLWGATFIGISNWKQDKRNADYLYSIDPTGSNPEHVIYDDVDKKNKTGSEWRQKQNQDKPMTYICGALACALHVWAALDASSQAEKHNKATGIHISCGPDFRSVSLVLTKSF